MLQCITEEQQPEILNHEYFFKTVYSWDDIVYIKS